MANGAGKKQSRDERERARAYRARQEFHESLTARRRRDNLVAGVAGGVLLVAIIAAQVAYFTVGPGTPRAHAHAVAHVVDDAGARTHHDGAADSDADTHAVIAAPAVRGARDV